MQSDMTWKSIPCLFALLLVSCGHAAKKSGTATYSNPVIAADAPDPSVIRAEDGRWYLYATGRGYSIFRSDDLVAWERVGTAFTDETWPAAVRNGRRGDLWAPEIRRIGDKYVLFYTLWFGDVKYSVIGYAVSDAPEGPFTDRGVLVDSQQIGVEQSIDQYYYEEEGKAYLFWGSFRNLYVMELDVRDDATIASSAPTSPSWPVRATCWAPTWTRRAARRSTTAANSSCSATTPSPDRGTTPDCWRMPKAGPGCSIMPTTSPARSWGAWACSTRCAGTRKAGPISKPEPPRRKLRLPWWNHNPAAGVRPYF